MNDKIQQHLAALGTFKDWSNYLLVTTVAALGWVSKTDHAPIDFSVALCISICISMKRTAERSKWKD